MSLYNALFGTNPFADMLLAMLNLKREDTGRFRDVFVDTKEDGTKTILIYTRNGGGNREEYAWVFDKLQNHPNYLRDYDDDFDCTYAYIEFSIPEKFHDVVRELFDDAPAEKVSDRFLSLIEKMESNPTDPEVENALSIGRSIFDAINDAAKKV